MIGNFIAYLVVALATLFAIWKFLPASLKRKAAPTLARLFGQKAARKLETAGSCGSCDSCNACSTPAKSDTQPLSFKK